MQDQDITKFRLFSAPEQELANIYLADKLTECSRMRVASAILALDILSRPGQSYVISNKVNPSLTYRWGEDVGFGVAYMPIAELANAIRIMTLGRSDMIIVCDEPVRHISELSGTWEAGILQNIGHFTCGDGIAYSFEVHNNLEPYIIDLLTLAWYATLFGVILQKPKPFFPTDGKEVAYSDLLTAFQKVEAIFTTAYDDEGAMIWVDDSLNFHPENLPIPL